TFQVQYAAAVNSPALAAPIPPPATEEPNKRASRLSEASGMSLSISGLRKMSFMERLLGKK
ncbi:hypothetical protein LTR28_002428, partial [Elasticomyces elasticus]